MRKKSVCPHHLHCYVHGAGGVWDQESSHLPAVWLWANFLTSLVFCAFLTSMCPAVMARVIRGCTLKGAESANDRGDADCRAEGEPRPPNTLECSLPPDT